MCMLHSLVLLRRLFKVHLSVFHFDHRLRTGSEADAAYVSRAAAKLGLPFHLHVAGSAPGRGESVEDWAHRARLWALARAMRDEGATKGAIAHTLDDQAETLLIGLVRGGGLDAVAGIRPAHGPHVRPLIGVSREDVEAFVRALHLRPRTDPTNRDTRLLRNAIRLKAIPALEKAAGREVGASLARTASLLRADADELEHQASLASAEFVEEEPSGLAISVKGLGSVPRPIAARVARAAIYRMGALPSAEAIDAVLDLAVGRPGRRRDLAGGLLVSRDREYVHLSSPESRHGEETE